MSEPVVAEDLRALFERASVLAQGIGRTLDELDHLNTVMERRQRDVDRGQESHERRAR